MYLTRLAIVGCGAVTRKNHLPALAGLDAARVVCLVDVVEARAAELAAGMPDPPAVLRRSEEVVGIADAAILAVPHHLHELLAVPLLRAGVHVFIEKPMALSVASCERMIEAADRSGATLAVGLARRYFPNYRWLRRALSLGVLGKLLRFDIEEGGPYAWPLASGFMFDREQAGGGVLFDAGAHVVDALLYWLGDVELIEMRDDARGGVEAEAHLRVRAPDRTGGPGAEGTILLSRLRNLRNSARFEGTSGTVELGLMDGTLRWDLPDDAVSFVGAARDAAPAGPNVFVAQFAAWLAALATGRPPPIDGREGKRSVAWIEHAMSQRKPLPLEVWESAPDLEVVA